MNGQARITEFRIVNQCHVWKVYDRNQKYRCSFNSRVDAEEYVKEHSKHGRRSTDNELLPVQPACVAQTLEAVL